MYTILNLVGIVCGAFLFSTGYLVGGIGLGVICLVNFFFDLWYISYTSKKCVKVIFEEKNVVFMFNNKRGIRVVARNLQVGYKNDRKYSKKNEIRITSNSVYPPFRAIRLNQINWNNLDQINGELLRMKAERVTWRPIGLIRQHAPFFGEGILFVLRAMD